MKKDVKHQLKKYSKEINIPKTEQILPSSIIEQEKNEKRRSQILWKRRLIGGVAVAGVCLCAGIALNRNENLKSSDPDNMTGIVSGASEEALDGIAGSEHTSASPSTEKPLITEKPSNSETFGDGAIKDENKGDSTNKYEMSDEMSGCIGEAPMDDVEVAYEAEAGCVEEPYPMAPAAGENIAAGTLTGGEINDLGDWENWIKTLNKDYLNSWSMLAEHRVSVYVHSGDIPAANKTVILKGKGVQGQIDLYEAKTNEQGMAYLFWNINKTDEIPQAVEVVLENQENVIKEYEIDASSGDFSADIDLSNQADLQSEMNKKLNVDLLYLIDTTGSMSDELNYLKVEIADVIKRSEEASGANIRTSVNFYRDHGDEYVVQYYDFREDAEEVAKIVSEQNADGGGDEPEAVAEALDNAIYSHNWSEESDVRLMFLVLDAPPHIETAEKIYSEILKAAQMGIRVIPVAASGASEETQQLFRSMAILTGGTFLFLDDNSGVGGSHDVSLDPSEYTSEHLNDMMIRVIASYCKREIEKVEVETSSVETEEESMEETTEFVQ